LDFSYGVLPASKLFVAVENEQLRVNKVTGPASDFMGIDCRKKFLDKARN